MERRLNPRPIYKQTIFLDHVVIDTVAQAQTWMRRIDEAIADYPEIGDVAEVVPLRDAARSALLALETFASVSSQASARLLIDTLRRRVAFEYVRAKQAKTSKGAA